MLLLLLGLLLVQAHDAAGRQHRSDGAHAELGCFLQRPIHPLAARHALHQRDLQRRLGGAGRLLAELHVDIVAVETGDLRAELAPRAIEDVQRGPFTHTQDASDVVRARGRQAQLSTRGQRTVAEDPVQSHARLVASEWSGVIRQASYVPARHDAEGYVGMVHGPRLERTSLGGRCEAVTVVGAAGIMHALFRSICHAFKHRFVHRCRDRSAALGAAGALAQP